MIRTAVRPLAAAFRSQRARSFSLSAYSLSGRRYTPDHEWVSLSNGVGTIGISDYAQKALGDVVFVEAPSVGTVLKVKALLSLSRLQGDVYAPVSGEVVEVNAALADEPSLINSSPYEKGWIAKIKLSDESQFQKLMDEAAYAKHIE